MCDVITSSYTLIQEITHAHKVFPDCRLGITRNVPNGLQVFIFTVTVRTICSGEYRCYTCISIGNRMMRRQMRPWNESLAANNPGAVAFKVQRFLFQQHLGASKKSSETSRHCLLVSKFSLCSRQTRVVFRICQMTPCQRLLFAAGGVETLWRPAPLKGLLDYIR